MKLPECRLLLRDDVLSGASKDLAAIGKGDVASRGVVGAILRPKAFDLHRIPGFQHVSGNSTPHQHARRTSREAPGSDLSAVVLYIHVEPDMRVHPLDF